MKRINTRQELIELAGELGVRPNWHEPDEQDLEVEVRGRSFDNAGFWPHGDFEEIITEKYVVIYQGEPGEREPVACVNLATLFAWATGYQDGF